MNSPVLGAAFEQWQSLTDEYRRELQAMQRGDPGARERANQIAHALTRLNQQASERDMYGSRQRGREPR